MTRREAIIEAHRLADGTYLRQYVMCDEEAYDTATAYFVEAAWIVDRDSIGGSMCNIIEPRDTRGFVKPAPIMAG